ncbi:MAG: ABC transporter permease [Verrucomicrobiota bacterium]
MPSIPIKLPDHSAWKTQVSVIWALYLRETRTRFGKYNLGLIWALIEPMSMIAVKAALFGFILKVTIPSIPYPIFLAAGFIPFRFFTGMVNRSVTAISSNQALLVYRQIKPLDPFIARLLQEIVVSVLIGGIFLFAAAWLLAAPDFKRPLMILISLTSLIMMSSGLGIFLGVLGHTHKELEKIVPMLTTPLLLISCVLYPLSRVPSNYQYLFIWNPLVVIFESFRMGLYSHYPTPDLPIFYPLCCGIVSLWIGLAYYYKKFDILYLPSRV